MLRFCYCSYSYCSACNKASFVGRVERYAFSLLSLHSNLPILPIACKIYSGGFIQCVHEALTTRSPPLRFTISVVQYIVYSLARNIYILVVVLLVGSRMALKLERPVTFFSCFLSRMFGLRMADLLF